MNGRSGCLVWPGITPDLQLGLPFVRQDSRFKLRSSDSYAGILGQEFICQFFGAVRGGASLTADLSDALNVARVIAAAAASSWHGRHEPVRSQMRTS